MSPFDTFVLAFLLEFSGKIISSEAHLPRPPMSQALQPTGLSPTALHGALAGSVVALASALVPRSTRSLAESKSFKKMYKTHYFWSPFNEVIFQHVAPWCIAVLLWAETLQDSIWSSRIEASNASCAFGAEGFDQIGWLGCLVLCATDQWRFRGTPLFGVYQIGVIWCHPPILKHFIFIHQMPWNAKFCRRLPCLPHWQTGHGVSHVRPRCICVVRTWLPSLSKVWNGLAFVQIVSWMAPRRISVEAIESFESWDVKMHGGKTYSSKSHWIYDMRIRIIRVQPSTRRFIDEKHFGAVRTSNLFPTVWTWRSDSTTWSGARLQQHLLM